MLRERERERGSTLKNIMAPCITAHARVHARRTATVTADIPVKKVRKGTRCCTECKRRKIRCDRVDYSPQTSTACMQCKSRNLDDRCRPQFTIINGQHVYTEITERNHCKRASDDIHGGDSDSNTSGKSQQQQQQLPVHAKKACLSLKQLIGMPCMDQRWALPPWTKSDKDASSRLLLSAFNYCRSVSAAHDFVIDTPKIQRYNQFEDEYNRLYLSWDSLNLPIYATQLMPPKSVCDRLVTRYFSSDKAWLRVESFYKEYSEFWSCTQGLDIVKMALVFIILATECVTLDQDEMSALLTSDYQNINCVALDSNRLFEASHLLIESVSYPTSRPCRLQVATIETMLLQAGYLYQVNVDVKLKRNRIYEARRIYHLLASCAMCTTDTPTRQPLETSWYANVYYQQNPKLTSDELCRLNHVRSCIALISQFCTS